MRVEAVGPDGQPKENKVHPPSFDNKWNLNTVLTALAIMGFFVAGVTAWNDQQSQNTMQAEWQSKAEVREGVVAAINANQDVTINKIDGQVDRLSDRVSATEKSIDEMGDRFDRMIEAITAVRDNGTEMNTKLEVFRTILERIEKQKNINPALPD